MLWPAACKVLHDSRLSQLLSTDRIDCQAFDDMWSYAVSCVWVQDKTIIYKILSQQLVSVKQAWIRLYTCAKYTCT